MMMQCLFQHNAVPLPWVLSNFSAWTQLASSRKPACKNTSPAISKTFLENNSETTGDPGKPRKLTSIGCELSQNCILNVNQKYPRIKAAKCGKSYKCRMEVHAVATNANSPIMCWIQSLMTTGRKPWYDEAPVASMMILNLQSTNTAHTDWCAQQQGAT